MSSAIPGLPPGGGDFGVTAKLSGQSVAEGGGDFMKTLQDAVAQVGELQNEADARVNQLLTGNGQDVHSAMIAVEKSSLAFAMMVQVRNKIVQAYQQVSGMQF